MTIRHPLRKLIEILGLWICVLSLFCVFRIGWIEVWKSRAEGLFFKGRPNYSKEICKAEVLNLVRGDFTIACLEYPFAAKKWTVNYFTGLIISQGVHE